MTPDAPWELQDHKDFILDMKLEALPSKQTVSAGIKPTMYWLGIEEKQSQPLLMYCVHFVQRGSKFILLSQMWNIHAGQDFNGKLFARRGELI